MAISRMQQPRQMYGLGSLVKKAVRGVKKIVKSPLGKAALLYAGTAGLGSLGAGKGFGSLLKLGTYAPSSIAKNYAALAPSLFANPTTSQMKIDGMTRGFFPKMLNKMSTGQKIFTGLGATAIATPFLQKAFGVGPYEEIEEEIDESYIPPGMALAMARNRDPYMNFLPNQQFAQSGFYLPQTAANGGRIGYASGMRVEDEEDELSLGLPTLARRGYQQGELVEEASMTEGPQLPPEAEKFLRQEYQKYVAQGGDLSYPEFKQLVLQQAAGEQGPEQKDIMTTESETVQTEPQMPMMMAEGGLMNLGGMEKDYRAEGGFVPIGKREKADDVPARLSVNEFVFTADAVRNAGGGDIDKGAEVLENLMDHLEAGGKVSKDSQGLEGAQDMYNNMKQLETRVV